jgi:DNA-binding response OmpR family regulator
MAWAAYPDSNSTRRGLHAEASRTEDLNPMLIAIVDDDPRMRMLLKEEASDEGWQCLCYGNGHELLTSDQLPKVDLVLLDLIMPIMDGLTCLRELRRQGFSQHVIVLTALCDPHQKQQSLEAGANQYLLKTSLLNGLRALVPN